MLIDEFMPGFDFSEQHALTIAAAPAAVEAALLRLDLSGSRVIRTLFALRGMPRSSLSFGNLERSGFRRLGRDPQREVVLGLIGRFWRITGDLQRFDPAAFHDFSEAGYAKAAWNFSFTPAQRDGTLVRTETRILCTDASSRRRFGRYWRVIRPFSGWIRRAMLHELRRASEARATVMA